MRPIDVLRSCAKRAQDSDICSALLALLMKVMLEAESLDPFLLRSCKLSLFLQRGGKCYFRISCRDVEKPILPDPFILKQNRLIPARAKCGKGCEFLISTRTRSQLPSLASTHSRGTQAHSVRDQQTDLPTLSSVCVCVGLCVSLLCTASSEASFDISSPFSASSTLHTDVPHSHRLLVSQSIGAVDFLRRLCRRPSNPP